MSFKETEIGKIPLDWDVAKLGDVADVLSGFAFKSKDFVDNGVPVIKIKNIVPPYVTTDDSVYVSQELYELSEKYQLNYNDILISMTGSNYNQLSSAVGKVGRVRLKDEPMLLNQRVGKILTNEKKCNKEFLYYNISTMETRYRLALSAGGSANQANVSPKQIKSLLIPYPPLEEQKVIAHILSTLDEKIEVNNQINKVLENMAQAIFKQWFVDFEFPNEDGEPYKSSGGEMVESELGMIPKGWEVGNLAESKLTNLVKTGIAEFSGEKIYLATADVDKSNILSNTTKVTYNERPSRANMQPKENTVWFAKMKDSRKLIRVSRGSKDLIENYIFSTGFAGINVKEGLNYIWSFICSNDFDIRKNNLCHGTTMQAINNSNISNIPLLLPKEEMIQIFEGVTNYLYESEYLRKKENEKLAEIRDSLLPKLMSGEIRVPLDEDGDAS